MNAYFPSPHMALLWLLARQSVVMLIGLGLAWGTMGYFLTFDLIAAETAQHSSSALNAFSNFLLFITVSYRSFDNERASLLGLWKGVHGQLPVFWTQLVRADLYFIALSATFLSLCFLLGSSIAAPASLLSGPGMLYIPALWVVVAARPVIGALSSVVSRLTKISVAVGGIIAFALVLYMIMSLSHDDGAPMPKALPVTCLVAIPVVMVLARTGLNWAGPRLWRRETDLPPMPIAANRQIFVESPRELKPFETAWAACQWFFARRLAALATQTAEWLIIALSLLLLFVVRFGLNLPYTVTPYIAGAAGFVYLMNIRYLERTGAVHHLPVSVWTATQNHLRLITVCIAFLYATSFPVYAFELVSINGPGGVTPMDPFWLLWVIWAGLSLAPLLVVGCTFLMLGETHFPPQIQLLAIVVLVGMAVGRDVVEGTRSPRNVALTLLPVVVCTVGLWVVNSSNPDSAAMWTAREIMGGAIVLTLLRYNVATHRMPQTAAFRIGALLVFCLVAAVAAVSQFGPPSTPNNVVDLFLGLGVVAPLFLPILWIPHGVEFARAQGRRAPEPAAENEREIWENLR